MSLEHALTHLAVTAVKHPQETIVAAATVAPYVAAGAAIYGIYKLGKWVLG